MRLWAYDFQEELMRRWIKPWVPKLYMGINIWGGGQAVGGRGSLGGDARVGEYKWSSVWGFLD